MLDTQRIRRFAKSQLEVAAALNSYQWEGVGFQYRASRLSERIIESIDRDVKHFTEKVETLDSDTCPVQNATEESIDYGENRRVREHTS